MLIWDSVRLSDNYNNNNIDMGECEAMGCGIRVSVMVWDNVIIWDSVRL